MSKLFSAEFEETYFGNQGALMLRTAIQERGSVKAYINETRRRLAHVALLKHIAELSEFVEPEDRSLGFIDKEAGATQAFFNGARVALGGLWLLTDVRQRELLSTIKFNLPQPDEDDDAHDFRHGIANEILSVGQKGFAAADAYHGLYEDIERDVSDLVRYDLHAQAGFGIPFYLVSSAMYVVNMTEFESEIKAVEATDVNEWDSALESLLKDEA